MTRAKDISKILTDADISGTLDVTGETTLATHLNLGDNDKIKLGASGDLEIYHDGSHSYIQDTGTGDLVIAATHLRFMNASGADGGSGKTFILCTDGGSVEFYHNNSTKFETTSDGVKFTGDVIPDGNNTRKLGSSSKYLNSIYVNNIFTSSLPTTSSGLSTGQFYNDNGTVKIVTSGGSGSGSGA